MANTAQHIEARNDDELLARFIATAEPLGVEDPQYWVQNRIGKLVNQEVSAGQKVSDVHAYADQVRKTYIDNTPALPGADLAAVTDAFLITAIQSVIDDEAPSE